MSIQDYLSTPVKKTTINGVLVSTVKLGRLMNGGMYETCLFAEDGDSTVVGQYVTLGEALEGHCAAVLGQI